MVVKEPERFCNMFSRTTLYSISFGQLILMIDEGLAGTPII